MINVDDRIKIKNIKNIKKNSKKKSNEKSQKKEKENRIMRTKLLKKCFCFAFSNDFDNDWKRNLDGTYDSEKMNHVMLCFFVMMYAGWKVMVCEKHCAMIKKIVGIIFDEFAKNSRKNLKKLWTICYDFGIHSKKNFSFFKKTQ